MELSEYLRHNQSQPQGASPHRRLIRDVVSRLDSIGIAQPAEVYLEVELVDGKNQIGQVDIVALTPNELYIVEAKTLQGESKKSEEHARQGLRQQLERAYGYFKRRFKVAGRCIGVLRYGGDRFHHYELQTPIEDLVLRLNRTHPVQERV